MLLAAAGLLLPAVAAATCQQVGDTCQCTSPLGYHEAASYVSGGCTTINGSIEIGPGTANIEGLESLEVVTGSLTFVRTDLTVIDLPSLEVVGGLLHFADNAALSDIGDFALLESAQAVSIKENANLVSLGMFPKLSALELFFSVVGNAKIERVEGFASLESIGLYIEVDENQGLKTISGFDSLISIGSVFYVADNAMLGTIDGFGSLVTAQEFTIKQNPKLTLINGFTSMAHCGGDFLIVNNQLLFKVTGFSSLALVHGSLRISDNPSLMLLDLTYDIPCVAKNTQITGNGRTFFKVYPQLAANQIPGVCVETGNSVSIWRQIAASAEGPLKKLFAPWFVSRR
jgi:hypothetical protein